MRNKWTVRDLKDFIDRLSEDQLDKEMRVSIETWEDAPVAAVTMTNNELIIEA